MLADVCAATTSSDATPDVNYECNDDALSVVMLVEKDTNLDRAYDILKRHITSNLRRGHARDVTFVALQHEACECGFAWMKLIVQNASEMIRLDFAERLMQRLFDAYDVRADVACATAAQS